MSLPENGLLYPPPSPAINIVADCILFPLWIAGLLTQSLILYTFLFRYRGAYSTHNKFVIVICICDWCTAAGCMVFRIVDWRVAAVKGVSTGWSTGEIICCIINYVLLDLFSLTPSEFVPHI